MTASANHHSTSAHALVVRDLSALAGDELDQAFARDISSEQHAEIVQMMRWSRTWFGRVWSSPHA